MSVLGERHCYTTNELMSMLGKNIVTFRLTILQIEIS